jgi:hypothetical protein
MLFDTVCLSCCRNHRYMKKQISGRHQRGEKVHIYYKFIPLYFFFVLINSVCLFLADGCLNSGKGRVVSCILIKKKLK